MYTFLPPIDAIAKIKVLPLLLSAMMEARMIMKNVSQSF